MERAKRKVARGAKVKLHSYRSLELEDLNVQGSFSVCLFQYGLFSLCQSHLKVSNFSSATMNSAATSCLLVK